MAKKLNRIKQQLKHCSFTWICVKM